LVEVLDVLDQVEGKVGVQLAPSLGEGAGFQKPELGVVLQDAPRDAACPGEVAQGVEGGER